jgi:hypothetical protein
MERFQSPPDQEDTEVFSTLSELEDDERLKFDKLLVRAGVPAEHTNLFRFNLTIRGIGKLVEAGAAHLHNSALNDTSIRGYKIDASNKKLTVFWPGGLIVHNDMDALLKDVFPGTPLEQVDRYKLVAKGPNGEFQFAEVKEFKDQITRDAQR